MDRHSGEEKGKNRKEREELRGYRGRINERNYEQGASGVGAGELFGKHL